VSGAPHGGVANRIASTVVHKRWWVSTIKLAVPIENPRGPRMDYETAVFDLDDDDLMTTTITRYPDAITAKRGHRRIVTHIRKRGESPI
jgi:hypothetical protein